MIKVDDRILGRVEPQWRKPFVEFVTTGEAESAFLEMLDRDERYQDLVDLAAANCETTNALRRTLKMIRAEVVRQLARRRAS